jgi:purine-nucleoside phosphorylase
MKIELLYKLIIPVISKLSFYTPSTTNLKTNQFKGTQINAMNVEMEVSWLYINVATVNKVRFYL